MRWIITEPDGVTAALVDPDSGSRREPTRSCLDFVRESMSLSRVERLDVYAEAYFIRLYKTLEEDFLAVRRALGLEAFRGVISEYLIEHPSQRPDLIELGRRFPAFLAHWLEEGEQPALPDLARLEWARAQAYFALDPRAWDPSVLADAENARLSLAPAVRLIVSEWAIDELRASLREAAESLEAPVAPHARRDRRRLAVYREQGRVACEAVGEAEFRLLSSAERGETLGQACEALGELAEATPEALSGWISKWASRGAIVCDKPGA